MKKVIHEITYGLYLQVESIEVINCFVTNCVKTECPYKVTVLINQISGPNKMP